MAQLTKIAVKQTFEAGDRPTDQNFTDLFDSILFIGEINENTTSANVTSISNNFSVGGTLNIDGAFIVDNLVMFGKASGEETHDKPLQVYGDENETIVFASGSISNVLFEGISGDVTSSIKLTDDLASVSFGTHTNKGVLSIHENDIITYSTGSTPTDDNIIFMSGSLGVGITPSTKLHVSSLTSIDSSSLANAHILVGTTALGLGFDTNEIQFKGHDGYVGVISTHDLNFATNATTRMTIKSSGYVGIGTTSPGHTLSVKGNIAIRNSVDTTDVMLFRNTNSVATNPDIQFNASALLAAEADFIINIDSDGSGGTAKFSIRKDSTTSTGGTEIFSVDESSHVIATSFEGDGSLLTNVVPDAVTGLILNAANNRIATTNNVNTLNGEANLTFDGYRLYQSLNIGTGLDGNTSSDGYYLDGQNGGFLSLTNGTSTSNQFVASISGIASTNMTSTGVAGLYIKGRSAQDNKNNPSIILRGEKLNAASSFSDILRIQNYTTTYITVDSTGSMGIGTTSPSAKLHLSSGTSGDAILIIESDTDNNNENDNPQLQFKQDGGLVVVKAGITGVAGTIFTNSLDNTAYFGSDGGHPLQLYTDNSARLTILGSSGNVGIGTNSPATKLQVGTTSTTSDSIIRVLSGDSKVAGFEAYGSNQGTGYLYVGQSTTHGGGIRYDGDGSPGVVGATDHTTFFRRTSGTDTAVFSYPHNSDIVTFYGGNNATASIRVSGGIGRTAHNVGHLEGSYNNIGNNDTKTNPIYIIGSNYSPTTTTLGNMYGIGYTRTGGSYATFLDGNSGWGMYVAADGDARVFLGASAASNSYFTAGNVGIGTTTPTTKLHVVGTGNITGNTTIGGTLGVSGVVTLSSNTVTSTSDTTALMINSSNVVKKRTLGTGAFTSTYTLPSATSATLGGVTFANGVNNRVLTAMDADSINGESNLTFNGSTLAVTGNATISSTLNVAGVVSAPGLNGHVIKEHVFPSSGDTAVSVSLNSSGNYPYGYTRITNVTITFTAPPSGEVIISTILPYIYSNAYSGQIQASWNTSNTGAPNTSYGDYIGGPEQFNVTYNRLWEQYETGLTSGTTYTRYLWIRQSQSGVTSNFKYAGNYAKLRVKVISTGH